MRLNQCTEQFNPPSTSHLSLSSSGVFFIFVSVHTALLISSLNVVRCIPFRSIGHAQLFSVPALNWIFSPITAQLSWRAREGEDINLIVRWNMCAWNDYRQQQKAKQANEKAHKRQLKLNRNNNKKYNEENWAAAAATAVQRSPHVTRWWNAGWFVPYNSQLIIYNSITFTLFHPIGAAFRHPFPHLWLRARTRCTFERLFWTVLSSICTVNENIVAKRKLLCARQREPNCIEQNWWNYWNWCLSLQSILLMIYVRHDRKEFYRCTTIFCCWLFVHL